MLTRMRIDGIGKYSWYASRSFMLTSTSPKTLAHSFTHTPILSMSITQWKLGHPNGFTLMNMNMTPVMQHLETMCCHTNGFEYRVVIYVTQIPSNGLVEWFLYFKGALKIVSPSLDCLECLNNNWNKKLILTG